MTAISTTSWLPANIQEDLKDAKNAAEFETGQELLRGVVKRSTTDPEFRRTLVATPQQAIAQYYKDTHGVELVGGPQNLDIHFIENQGDLTMVLPPAIDPEAALSDAELQTVSGGVSPVAGAAAAAVISNMACLGFAAGVATVVLIAWALSD